MRRNRNMPIVLLLGLFLVLLLIILAIKHIKVYIVFSSGLGPFFLVALIILLMIVVFLKGI
ncbi:hypothetical protein PZE06_02635 [Robertmurraya sp. DFI.2.37]|uniref:hypothetical protein n=1 Tax=Robertmurraya sp. DFI.2.37 TaxID=3031819 RepID=UPI0012475634|nr:hypothetical protein [Robertmurraya sp. DFI.2.37]MDF1507073.1 hypothetical protein [Robertmurraya sp. DFI.2.37]